MDNDSNIQMLHNVWDYVSGVYGDYAAKRQR